MINIDNDFLYNLYYNEKKSFSEIGEIIGCSGATICYKFKRLGWKSRQLSDAMKLVEHTDEWKKNQSKSLKGRIVTSETRKKISLSRVGIIPYNKGLRKCNDPEKITYGVSGEKHWNWRGGVSKENIKIRNTSEYKNWRDKVFRRDNWICKKCGKNGSVEAHHISLFSENKELQFDVNNGITLCKKCHRENHNGKKCKK